ncbi:hypothetical protein ACX40Y_15535 [Sphingomonas sp. RS6]
MKIAVIRAYLYESIEFFLYFIFMTFLGAAMYVLVSFAPQAHSRWYINTSICVAVLTALYAVRMFNRYRRIHRHYAGMIVDDAEVEAEAVPVDPLRERKLRWAERIAAEQLGLEGVDAAKLRELGELDTIDALARLAALRAEGDRAANQEEEDELALDPTLSLEAIRQRIAERMDREDRERQGSWGNRS